MHPYRTQSLICNSKPQQHWQLNDCPSFAPKLIWQHNLVWIDVRLWITFSYCIITQFSMNMETFHCINIIDLDFLLAVVCYIAIPSFKKTSEFWNTFGLEMFRYEAVDQNYLIPYSRWRTGDLSATLAQSQEPLLVQFSKTGFIYWNLKWSTLLIKGPWQLLMLILQWTLDSPYIFRTKCPAWNKRVCLVFTSLCYSPPDSSQHF